MTHERIRSSKKGTQRCPTWARRLGLTVGALLLTAGASGGALAGNTAARDTATITISVSVSPQYGLTRASRTLRGDDVAANLCIRTNAARLSMPVTGAWLGRERAFDFVLPPCGELHSAAALAQTMDDRRSGVGVLLVRPE